MLISFQLQWQNMLDCTENDVMWQKMYKYLIVGFFSEDAFLFPQLFLHRFF